MNIVVDDKQKDFEPVNHGGEPENANVISPEPQNEQAVGYYRGDVILQTHLQTQLFWESQFLNWCSTCLSTLTFDYHIHLLIDSIRPKLSPSIVMLPHPYFV